MVRFEVDKCYKAIVSPDQPYVCVGRRETPKRVKVYFCSMYFFRRDGEYTSKMEYYAHDEGGVECADIWPGRRFNFRADTFDDRDRVYDDPRYYRKPKKERLVRVAARRAAGLVAKAVSAFAYIISPKSTPKYSRKH